MTLMSRKPYEAVYLPGSEESADCDARMGGRKIAVLGVRGGAAPSRISVPSPGPGQIERGALRILNLARRRSGDYVDAGRARSL